NSSGNAPFARAGLATASIAAANPKVQPAESRNERERCVRMLPTGSASTAGLQAFRALRRRTISAIPKTSKAATDTSALAHPPLLPAVAFESSLTTMNPLSWEVIQMSPESAPRSFGKLALEVDQSKFRTKSGAAGWVELAYCDPGRTLLPCAGGLKYAISFGYVGSLMSKKRQPDAKRLQAAIFASS